MQLSWQIANRFRRSQTSSGYLSFMSFSSISGIGLGCFVLIALLSVMNGFERELTQKLLAIIPHGEIFSHSTEGIDDWQSFQATIEQDERVAFVSPYTQITGLIQKQAALKPIALSGLALSEDEIQLLNTAVTRTELEALKSTPNGVVLGRSIANAINAKKGQTIDLLIPKNDFSNKLSAPQRVQLTVVGTLAMGGEVDAKLGLMNLATASQLLNVKHGAQGVRITMHDPFIAKQVVYEYGYQFPQAVLLSDWTRTHGHIFQDIQLVRLVVYIVLTLVIAVACFNVVSTLVMSVRAKQSSIAILMSMGATPGFIKRVFLLQGLTNGIIGTVLGTGLALVIVPQLSNIVGFIETLLGVSLLSSDIYFIDFLPTSMQASDVITTVIISISLSGLAAYYPAKRASRVQPASALS